MGYMTSAPCTETKLRMPESHALQFLHDEAVLDIAHAGAAVAFQVGAEEAEFGHLRNDLGGNRASR